MTQLQTAEAPFDESAAAAFSEKVAETLNAGAATVMMSIGHRTGLFDVMAALAPSTSAQIADRIELNERYVREWLAAMVTAGIIDYKPNGRTYELPAERAASLTRTAALGNMAIYAQFVASFGAVYEKILSCFETGEGTDYEDYPCFHQTMEEDSGQTVVPQLFDTLLPLAPELPDRLQAGIDVLDAGCGRGRALIAMAVRYPSSRFTGYDLSVAATEKARLTAQASELDNIRFVARDLSRFDEEQRYDFITTFDAVHDQKGPQQLLSSLCRALRSGGVYLMQDIGGSARLENNLDFPFATFLYTTSCMHCMPVSLGQGGQGLGTMWGWETAERMLGMAGFDEIERNILPHDPMNVWFVARKQ